MLGFFKRVFGGEPAPQINPDPFGRDPKPLVMQTVSVATPQPRVAPAIVLQRDELIDARTRIGGYRFSARRPDRGLQPDALAILEILSANHIAAFAERRLALIPIRAEDWISHDYRPLIGPNTVFLLTHPENPSEVGAWDEVARMIHDAKGKVALPAGSMANAPESLRDTADFLLVDFLSYSLKNFEQGIGSLKAARPELQLIVENVSRWAEHRYCIAHGVAYCIGPFTTEQDEELQTEEIGQSRLVLIDMLNQLRKESDLADIAQVAKRDPGVVVKLVAMANSPMLGLSHAVTSIDQAIMLLGREQLYRWISIGLFRAGSGSPRDEVLLELALARGRFLELIGRERHGKQECDELFLLGLLSLLDSLLGAPMSAVVERINLSPELKEVLLSSGGPLGRYLMLAIAVEKGRVENVARLAEQLGIALKDIELATVEALAWAEDAARGSG